MTKKLWTSSSLKQVSLLLRRRMCTSKMMTATTTPFSLAQLPRNAGMVSLPRSARLLLISRLKLM
jgi:hypothetical protein